MKTWKKTVGVVVGTAMDKTAVVQVERLQMHALTGKYIRRRTKYLAHDNHALCGVGDRVQIKYVGRMSKRKFWAVVDMVHRHPQLDGEPVEMSSPPASVVDIAE